MNDYSICYKECLSLDENWIGRYEWDVFISAFNSSERVKAVFDKVNAIKKYRLIFREYAYNEGDYPVDDSYVVLDYEEAGMVSFLKSLTEDIAKQRICVDITGFLRPQMMFLFKWFMNNRLKNVDVIYSEPLRYSNKEKTIFSKESTSVRQVYGYEGVHVTNNSKDLLIIGSGYDNSLISRAAESKNNAKKVQIFGFPPLSPDMYQENVLRAHRASEEVGDDISNNRHSFFAPANDPFVTANVLKRIVAEYESRNELTNLYLCPLATKSQVLGFIIYYLYEQQNKPASIIYPFSKGYSQETSRGISKIWKYTVELPV